MEPLTKTKNSKHSLAYAIKGKNHPKDPMTQTKLNLQQVRRGTQGQCIQSGGKHMELCALRNSCISNLFFSVCVCVRDQEPVKHTPLHYHVDNTLLVPSQSMESVRNKGRGGIRNTTMVHEDQRLSLLWLLSAVIDGAAISHSPHDSFDMLDKTRKILKRRGGGEMHKHCLIIIYWYGSCVK